MKKNVVFLSIGVLALTLFGFTSPEQGRVRLVPGGNFIADGVQFSAEDEQALNFFQRDSDRGYFVVCRTSKSVRGFTVGIIAGRACSSIVTFGAEDLDANEVRAQVNQIMVKYMGQSN